MAVSPVFFHVDMDAFFASVEQRDRPDCRGKPVIVGAAPGHRGVVSACSYEARAFGIHSAMPISEAFRLCPSGIYLPVDMERYHEVSERVMAIFARFTPVVQQMSVDEAFLDMTGTERLFGPPLSAGRKLKNAVGDSEGLAISVGIAANRYIAKLASTHSKPDGLLEINPGQEERFVSQLRLRDLWGIGKKTLERLAAEGIQSIVELSEYDEGELESLFGDAAGSYLFHVCRGIDPGIFVGEPKSRSISAETTFERDEEDTQIISRTLLELCQTVIFRMLSEGVRSRTVAIKMRYWDFTTTSSQKTLSHPLASAREAHRVAMELLRSRWDGRSPLRLLGVGCANLETEGAEAQPELFPEDEEKDRRVEKAVLGLKERFGHFPVQKASLIRPEGQKDQNASGKKRPHS
ncbi:MAG TPA: DNA polymerase IV [Spirochaetia bacterium]|nr:DNA polymerase IV [Spirochaetia bacterium]